MMNNNEPQQQQSQAIKKADKLMKSLLQKHATINDEENFKKVYGFGLEEYLQDRKTFAETCYKHADHIEKVTHNAGIANTVNGGVGAGAGIAAIAGILLAPVTVGWSLGFTITGAAGGLVSAVGSLGTHLVKDSNINADVAKIEEALAKFEDQDKVIFGLLSSFQDDMDRLDKLMKDPAVAKYFVKGASVIFGGSSTIGTIRYVTFARRVANILIVGDLGLGLEVSTAAGVAAPPNFPSKFIKFFGKEVGTTTSKMLGSAMGIFGIGLGVFQILDGAKDIGGSELANKYRQFAKDYNTQTDNIENTLNNLKKMMAET